MPLNGNRIGDEENIGMELTMQCARDGKMSDKLKRERYNERTTVANPNYQDEYLWFPYDKIK